MKIKPEEWELAIHYDIGYDIYEVTLWNKLTAEMRTKRYSPETMMRKIFKDHVTF